MDGKEKFKKTMIGTLLSISAPQVAEIIAMSGFDWVFIDMEHSAMSLESVQNAIQIMEGKILTIVRVPANDEVWIKRVLDTGCDGIIVPMVNSADEAKKVIADTAFEEKIALEIFEFDSGIVFDNEIFYIE